MVKPWPSSYDVSIRASSDAFEECVVFLGDERFDCSPSYGATGVSWLLSALRHITELRLVFHRIGTVIYWVEHIVPSTAFSALQHFKQLRSLEVRNIQYIAAAPLAVALDWMPSLVNLELNAYPLTNSDELTASLHRLCITQLDHLTISRRRLFFLVRQQPRAAVFRLRSLTVTPAQHLFDDGSNYSGQLTSLSSGRFPSLMHLTVSCEMFLGVLAGYQLPQLTSLALHASVAALVGGAGQVSPRLLRVRCSGGDVLAVPAVCQVVMGASHIQQLAIANCVGMISRQPRPLLLFSPTAAASTRLSHLMYLEFLDGLELADWMDLLSFTSPPVFAAQLTHLALVVRWQDRAAAASSLLHLPSLYPSLTHVHAGVQSGLPDGQPVGCAEWDDAMQSVMSAMGSAWCASAAEVVAWREDVAWRRSAGLPAQV